jgi:hypothetical protein
MNVFHRSKSQPIIKSHRSSARRDSHNYHFLKASPLAVTQKKSNISRSKSTVISDISKSSKKRESLEILNKTHRGTSDKVRQDLYDMILKLDERVQTLEKCLKENSSRDISSKSCNNEEV